MSKRFNVRVARRALRDLQGIHAWISEGSPQAADAWLIATRGEIALLALFPQRCPAAREAAAFPQDIRQLIVGKYRVLFCVEGSTVYVLHVRHAAMDIVTPEDLK